MALFHKYGWRRIAGALSGCAVTFILVCIFLTYERAAFVMALVFVVSGSAMGLTAAAKYRMDVWKWLVPFALACIFAEGMSNAGFSNTLQLHSTESQRRSASGRLHIWHNTFQMISQHPWLGTGPNTFARSYNDFERGVTQDAVVNRPFNLLLGLAEEYGVPFAILFLLLIIAQLRSAHIGLAVETNDRNAATFSICCLAGMYSLLTRELFYSSLFRSYQVAFLSMLVLAWTTQPSARPSIHNKYSASSSWSASYMAVCGSVIIASLFFMRSERVSATHFVAGSEKLHSGDFLSAAHEFEVSAELKPRSAYYHASYGLALESQVQSDSWDDSNRSIANGRPASSEDMTLRDRAEREYQVALALNPNDASFLNNLAWIEEAKGKKEEAARLVSRARIVSPTTPLYQVSASVLEDLAGKRDDSISSGANAISQSPVLVYSSWFVSLRATCANCMEAMLATAVQKTSKEYDRYKSPLALARLGALYFITGRKDEGYELLRIAVTAIPNLPEAWCFMARYEMEQANYTEARMYYEKALFLNPSSSTARLGLCQVAIQQGELGDPCEAAVEWRIGAGMRSSNSMRAEYLYGVTDRDAVNDDVLPQGFLSFCCFVRVGKSTPPLNR
ncbi:O-antigen ligase family protein [Granulicella mallensis]|nr:O-antigen ligase family protein [Granulicella mallensis]